MSARHRRAARGGFTLVEVLMAVTLIAIALLGLAGLGATALRAVRAGSMQTLAAAVAQSRIDSLASVPCDQIAPAVGNPVVTGSATVRGVSERWTASRLAADNHNMVRVTDTVRVPGRARPQVYLSIRACR